MERSALWYAKIQINYEDFKKYLLSQSHLWRVTRVLTLKTRDVAIRSSTMTWKLTNLRWSAKELQLPVGNLCPRTVPKVIPSCYTWRIRRHDDAALFVWIYACHMVFLCFFSSSSRKSDSDETFQAWCICDICFSWNHRHVVCWQISLFQV